MHASKLGFVALGIFLGHGTTALADHAATAELARRPASLADVPGLSAATVDLYEVEPNDACPGNLYEANARFHGALSPGDEDWVVFHCNEGDVLTMGTDLDGELPPVDTVIELYEDDCVTILRGDDDAGPGLYSLIEAFSAPYTGVYFLKIRPFSASLFGNYVLVGSCEPATGAGLCPVDLYESARAAIPDGAIPDAPAAGPADSVAAPPLTLDPNGELDATIADLVVELDFEHTWAGDLVITLQHTSSLGEVRTVRLLDRPGVPESPYGCGGDANPALGGSAYFFGSDPVLVPLGEGGPCPSFFPTGCYAVAPENVQGLEIFRGLRVGDGVWELFARDFAPGETGTLHEWAIHVLPERPVSIRETSWGAMKARYRH